MNKPRAITSDMLRQVTLEHAQFPGDAFRTYLQIYHLADGSHYINGIDFIYGLFPYAINKLKLSLDVPRQWAIEQTMIEVKPEHIKSVVFPSDEYSERKVCGFRQALPLDEHLLNVGMALHYKQSIGQSQGAYIVKVHTPTTKSPTLGSPIFDSQRARQLAYFIITLREKFLQKQTEQIPVTMTFNQAADAIQKYREEQAEIEAELECLEVSIELKSIEYRSLRGELEKLNMRYSDLNLRRSACRDGMVAAARVMTAFSDDCPSTAPAFEHPTLLE